ncbi:programmed cell death 1 ligand 1-like isoform X1 [Salvelinus fontinalis]|uniref:programmed cell death 1 ligand 1-like isoform X1 n=2 Tax=Salvelinus fontinalis TaxID=8038 RepID=UPI0024858E60|nr:programmed cell death 1 ligand 1-like isoform X1 [Salvelinus fontinalis]XP_055762732.1 programmed cell death 1 ligand 1-like isoform X1 [Salvelinus fontinalis]
MGEIAVIFPGDQVRRHKMNLFTQQTVMLWLCAARTLTTAELVKLSTVDSVVVPCHQSVTLRCDISTFQEGLSINHLAWVRQDGKHLCDVNATGVTGTHPGSTPSAMECRYTPQTQLTLTLLQVQPLEQGKYLCKLRSNHGVKEATTTVKLQECYREAQPSISDEGPTCTFTGVYPDGEVHWFQGPNNVTGDSTINTKQVEEGASLTITSSLKRKTVSGEGAYNCSLWIPSTGAYLTSSLVVPEHGEARAAQPNASGAGAIGPLWKPFLVLLSTLFLV